MRGFTISPVIPAMRDLGYNPDDLSVQISEMLVATTDTADSEIDQAVPEVLKLVRDKLKMDVVFVSEFANGRRVFRFVDTPPDQPVIAPGGSDPLQDAWCQRVVDGRLPQYIPDAQTLPASAPLVKALPFPIGTHLSVPIVLQSGEVYGTLCAFSFKPKEPAEADDLKVLRYTAQLAAKKIDEHRALARQRPPEPELSLVPIEKKKGW